VPVGLPPEDYAGFRAQSTACGANPPAEPAPQQYSAPQDLDLDPTTKLLATITTSCGEIVVEMDPAIAPETVNSFVFLANDGYFDGSVSHRIVPGFIVQAGDPTATGFGGPGYVIPDEFPPNDFLYTTGVLAMANAGPGSTGSQFFIMLSDRGLPPLYSAYGIVVAGLDTLDRLQSIPLGPNRNGEESVPLETVYIESVVVEPAPG
jgi:cyclophilin family peptidyl-prolyl cis-trans isomerase